MTPRIDGEISQTNLLPTLSHSSTAVLLQWVVTRRIVVGEGRDVAYYKEENNFVY
jgi:hypothetical protein